MLKKIWNHGLRRTDGSMEYWGRCRAVPGKNKSEPPVDHKLVHKLHDAWARANGYKLQAPSFKRLKKDIIKK